MPDRPPARSAPAELLATKLAPPRLPAGLVPRPPLLARLEAGLSRKLTLVVAPAGFGKSTLVAGWLAAQAGPTGWVSLEAGDNDPVRFWSYLFTVCRAFQPSLGKSALAALRAAQAPALEPLLTGFLNELARLSSQHLLVLEDYHAITTPAIHESLAFLLDHLPPALHPVLISRVPPPLPLARWRARDELSELTAADLRFSTDETRAFVQQALGRAPSPVTLAQLEARTEGWVTGLRLVALAAAHSTAGPDRTELAAAETVMTGFSGGHRHVIEYLVGEVLSMQPEPVQQFLLHTSGLSRLNASLCDAVTGQPGSARLLERLERDNLFLVPLEGQWYRYHTLFAEAMREYARTALGDDGLQAAQARASVWYEAHGLGAEAVEAALAAGAFERAAALAERALELRGNSEAATLRRWVELLPPAVLAAHPALCFSYAFVLLFAGDRRSPATPGVLEGPLRAAEAGWRAAANQAGLGQILAFRSMAAFWQDDLPRSFAQAEQALALLPEPDVFWRGISLSFAGMAERLSGRLAAAQRLLLEARALCEAAQNVFAAQAVTLSLAEIAAQQGDFDQALEYADLVMAAASPRDDMLDDQGQSALILAGVAYERDDLPAAERHAARAAEVGRQTSDETLLTQSELLLAQIEHARGQTAAAQQRLQALTARLRHPGPLREAQSAQARLWLSDGSVDLPAAERWAACLAAEPAAQPGPIFAQQEEREALLLARLRLRQAQPAAALAQLEPWRTDTHAQGRVRAEIEIHIIKALAGSNDFAPSATAALTRALTLAQPAGFRRLFLDEGQPLASLLPAVLPGLARRPLAAYAAGLLRALAPSAPGSLGSTHTPGAPPAPLFEPLSPQELRVLRLLVAGLPNAAIARELVVSTNTVKTQLKSIYRKLDVANRDEAREAAAELNLL